jgi:hypothetical protein
VSLAEERYSVQGSRHGRAFETVGGCCSISRRAAGSTAGQRRGTLSRRAGMRAPSSGRQLLLTSRRAAVSPAGQRRGTLRRIAGMLEP